MGLGLAVLFSACGNSRHVPVSDLRQSPLTATSYVIEKGDTLYAIAWRFNFDYKKLAAANGIYAPYKLSIGQVIQLTDKPSFRRNETKSHLHKTVVAASSAKTVRRKNKPPGSNADISYSNQKQKSVKKKSVESLPPKKDKGWLWTVTGKIVRTFSPRNELSKGIDIAASTGTAIKSSRSGKVVYAGSGLKGYGNLVIVRHDDIYLSAYAHNRVLLVKEGTRVSQGQKIAELGSSGTHSPKLHFEIRKRGKPINPLTLLPK